MDSRQENEGRIRSKILVFFLQIIIKRKTRFIRTGFIKVLMGFDKVLG